MQSNRAFSISLFIIFALSGFTGLVYESVWTHYLKLVLGHAAIAQTLVLLLFMGGMAIGAWLISKVSQRIKNPALVYAAIELVIGFFAILFHQIFVGSQDILYTVILPAIDSSEAASLVRWFWAAILIRYLNSHERYK